MSRAIDNILVIKLGALGDFIQALGPMAAIRKHHSQARITLLTTAPFKDFARQCGYFDEIRIDTRPKWFNIADWLSLRAQLNNGDFQRVYDLQNNDRSRFYFKLFGVQNRPEWVGTAKGASHRNTSPERTAGHAFDGHVQTLGLAGIEDIEIDTLDWMDGDISGFDLKPPYVLLVPGSAPSRLEKRWPAEHYGTLAAQLSGNDYQVIILGSAQEGPLAETIKKQCPNVLDLTGQTSFAQISALARQAAGAIGNDTGPMHLVAATGSPSLTLFSSYSNPAKHAPKGKCARTLYERDLQNLTADEVFKIAHAHIQEPAHGNSSSSLPDSSEGGK